jgi:hypothetical protein
MVTLLLIMKLFQLDAERFMGLKSLPVTKSNPFNYDLNLGDFAALVRW